MIPRNRPFRNQKLLVEKNTTTAQKPLLKCSTLEHDQVFNISETECDLKTVELLVKNTNNGGNKAPIVNLYLLR